MSTDLPYLLFDIGGTKTRISVSENGTDFAEPKIIPTSQDFYEGIDMVVSVAKQMSSKFGSAAGGVAGPLKKDHTGILNAPNLPEWNNKPLKEELEKRLEAPVYLENDAAMVGLGEAVDGAGEGERIVAYLTISTGVNGARIINGKIDESAMGFEIGKQIIDFDNSYLGNSTNFEQLVSGSSMAKRWKQNVRDINEPDKWEEEMSLVSVGIANMILFWSPNVVVVGGAVSQKFDPQVIKKYVDEKINIFESNPPVVMGKLKSIGGLHGAQHYLNSV